MDELMRMWGWKSADRWGPVLDMLNVKTLRSLREDELKKEMATHSSILAWKIPWIEEPGGLQSKGSQRVRHD